MDGKLVWVRRFGILMMFIVLMGGCTGAAIATAEGDVTHAQNPAEVVDPELGENETYLSATTSGSDSIVPYEAESDDTFGDETQLSLTVVPVGGSFNSEETITIFVGSFEGSDTPTPVSNEQVTVSIERPGGTTETFDIVTDSGGSAELSYDLSASNRGDGTYTISATSPNVDDKATIEPTVGPTISPAERTYEQVLIDEEVTTAFLVRDGTASVAQEPVTLTIKDPTGTVIDEQPTTTDSDGFVETQFTPQTSGRYEITAEIQETGSSTTQTVTSKEVLFRTDYELTQAVAGEQTSYGGYLFDTNGLLGDETISIEIVNPDTNEVVVDTTTTTGSNGFFSVDYNPGTAEDLRVTVTTADGQVAIDEDYVGIDEPQSTETEDVSLNAEFSESRLIPGEDTTLQIEATDGGAPIADRQVTVFPRLGYSGAPIDPQTVKTNETGEASVQLSIPEAAESANIDGQVYIQYNNEIIRDDLYAPIEKYNINFDVEDVAPGEEATLSVEATDRTTDTVVSNIPLQYNALYSGSGVASYARGELETGQSGTDSTTIAVPEDLAPDRAINYISRYASLGLYRVNMYDFPGSIEISSSGETDYGQPVAAPGEEISIEFTTPDSTDPTGLVFAEFGHNADAGARGTVIKSISASQDGTLTVPDYAGNDSYVSITVWAATSSDNFYAADQAIEIQTTADEGGGSNGDVPPIVGSNPPTDTTGDGTLNDINGDGEFDIVDVSAFFQNRQGDAVQNNTDLFDFNGDGEISIIDVQALLQQL